MSDPKLRIKDSSGQNVLVHQQAEVWRLNDGSLARLDNWGAKFYLAAAPVYSNGSGFMSASCKFESNNCSGACIANGEDAGAQAPVKDSIFSQYSANSSGDLEVSKTFRFTGNILNETKQLFSVLYLSYNGQTGKAYLECYTTNQVVLSHAEYEETPIVLPNLEGAAYSFE